MPELNEFRPDLFTLEDEDGNEQTFELLDTYEDDDNDVTYFALIPRITSEDAVDEDYFVILKRDDNDPDEYLNTIDDEEELDAIAEIFLSRIEAEAAEHDEHDGHVHGKDCDCC